ncbi:hypothetical protein C0992_004559 [Termitomyces sp. T32_za158]|nr:hypothetical protein C0992_004559 [Termitomyces sp. T32_za158]
MYTTNVVAATVPKEPVCTHAFLQMEKLPGKQTSGPPPIPPSERKPEEKSRSAEELGRLASDMEESEGETYSPSPLVVPPPNFTNLAIATSFAQNMNLDDDDTLIDPQYASSPTPSRRDRGSPGMEEQGTPAQSPRVDPPWIIRRTSRLSTDPPYTQPRQAERQPRRYDTPPQIPRNMTRTPTPVGGFPVIHLSTPPWFNLLPEQRDHFESYQGPKVWVRVWQASNAADLMTTSDKLKELIRGMTGEGAKLSTPQKEKEIVSKRRYDRHKPPYHFLVSGISDRAYEVLVTNPIISTPDASAFFLPYNPPTPCFLCTVEGFTLSIKTPEAIVASENIATDIVRRTLTDNEATIALIKSKLIGDTTSQHNYDPATTIVHTLEVKLARGEETIDRAAIARPRKPLWNIFFRQPPPLSWTNYFVLLQHIRDINFIDMDYGNATLVDKSFRLHCHNCKGADHNPAHCAYSTLEGWYGNGAAEKVEETAEFATSSRGDRSRQFDRNRNERRAEGWKGYG